MRKCFHFELRPGLYFTKKAIFLSDYINPKVVYSVISHQIDLGFCNLPFKLCSSFGYLYLKKDNFIAEYFHASDHNFLIKFPISIKTKSKLLSVITKSLNVNVREFTHIKSYNIKAIEISNVVFYVYSTLK